MLDYCTKCINMKCYFLINQINIFQVRNVSPINSVLGFMNLLILLLLATVR